MISALYYINLDRRPDRNQVMQENLNRAEVPTDLIHRFPAIDAEDFEKTDDVFFKNGSKPWDVKSFKAGAQRRVKEFGWNHYLFRSKASCWMSHLSVYRLASQHHPEEWTIICEDDIHFRYDYKRFLKLAQKTINKFPDAKIISMCSKKWQKHKMVNRLAYWNQDKRDAHVFVGGTDCYMIKNRAARELMEIADPFRSDVEKPSLDGHLYRHVVEMAKMDARAIVKKYWALTWGFKAELGEIDSDVRMAPNHRTVLDYHHKGK